MAASTRCLLPDHPVIEVVVYGHFSIEDAVTIRDESWALSQATGVHNVLLEMSGTTQTPSASEIVMFAEGMTQFGDPARLRSAVVRPAELIPATWVGLYVTALVNRGMNAAEFRNRDDAIAWLTA